MVGDGAGLRTGLCRGQGRDPGAFRADFLLLPARISFTDPHSPARPCRNRGGVLRLSSAPILALVDQLAGDADHPRAGLRLPAAARPVGPLGRDRELPRANRQNPVGADARGFLREPRTGPAPTRSRGAQTDLPALLPDHGRPAFRRASILRRQDVRPDQNRSERQPVEDDRRVRWWRPPRNRGRNGPVVDHSFLTLGSRGNGSGDRARRLLRRAGSLGGEAIARSQGLGRDDRGAWRRARPNGLGDVRGPALLSSGELFLRALTLEHRRFALLHPGAWPDTAVVDRGRLVRGGGRNLLPRCRCPDQLDCGEKRNEGRCPGGNRRCNCVGGWRCGRVFLGGTRSRGRCCDYGKPARHRPCADVASRGGLSSWTALHARRVVQRDTLQALRARGGEGARLRVPVHLATASATPLSPRCAARRRHLELSPRPSRSASAHRPARRFVDTVLRLLFRRDAWLNLDFITWAQLEPTPWPTRLSCSIDGSRMPKRMSRTIPMLWPSQPRIVPQVPAFEWCC